MQGISKLGTAELKENVLQLKERIVQPKGFSESIDPLSKTQTSNSTAEKYQKGSIYALKYSQSNLPEDAQLKADLSAALESYRNYYGSFGQRTNTEVLARKGRPLG